MDDTEDRQQAREQGVRALVDMAVQFGAVFVPSTGPYTFRPETKLPPVTTANDRFDYALDYSRKKAWRPLRWSLTADDVLELKRVWALGAADASGAAHRQATFLGLPLCVAQAGAVSALIVEDGDGAELRIAV